MVAQGPHWQRPFPKPTFGNVRFQNAGTAGHEDGHPHAIVAGGGFGGMTTALVLARAGWGVTVFEGDRVPPLAGPEDAFVRSRPGVPHARQTHGLLGRLTTELRARLPEVLDDLMTAGAVESPQFVPGALPAPAGGDGGMAVLLVRRTTLEWVLRRRVLAHPAIDWCDGTRVVGLTGTPATPATGGGGGAPAAVTGVVLGDGRPVTADLVVACTGRRGDVPGWLRAVGVEVDETEHPADLVYLTRWYRLPDGAAVAMSPKLTGDLGHLRYLAVPCDAGTLSVSIAVPSQDDRLRSHLSRADAFDRAAARLPGVEDVFVRHTPRPLSAVEPMGGFVNRLRRFTDTHGGPLVVGFHAVGDGHTCTNPYYGRGCSLTLLQAGLLADALAGATDPVARAAAYERACATEIEPWFHHAVEMDQVFDRSSPEDRNDDALDIGRALAVVLTAADSDPVLHEGLLRVINMLTRPNDLMAEPVFLARVLAVLGDPDAPGSLVRPGPSRADLLAH
jgi:2-polyprenyl-6-methoxyphenol hydroxylase-like FAD-dependent oxidoreductase